MPEITSEDDYEMREEYRKGRFSQENKLEICDEDKEDEEEKS